MCADALPAVTLILGGARSGKSAYAENLIEDLGGGGVYLATAEAGDEEMAARIRHHQERRGTGWRTVEVPLDLTGALKEHLPAGVPVLVDCLTLWLSNLLGAGLDAEAKTESLAQFLVQTPAQTLVQTPAAPVVLVSNEVGQGIIPDNALARTYMDLAGRMNQKVAAAANRVVLVTAGQPLVLKRSTILKDA